MGLSYSCSTVRTSVDDGEHVEDRSNRKVILRDAVAKALTHGGAQHVHHGNFGAGISMMNLSAPGSRSAVSAQEWLAGVYCARITISEDASGVNVSLQHGPAEVILESVDALWATSITPFRHQFNQHAAAGEVLQLDQQGLGFFHAFTVIDLSDEKHKLCFEKFADQLELALLDGPDALLYASQFRATGERRPVSASRPVREQKSMRVGPSEALKKVTVRDLRQWAAGPISMRLQSYSLLDRNCQHFARDLQEFLHGRITTEDTIRRLGDDKDVMLRAVAADIAALQHASERIKGDAEIMSAALRIQDDAGATVERLENEAALRCVKGNIVAIETVSNCLEDEDPDVRSAVVKALLVVGEKGNAQTIAAVTSRLEHSDRDVRQAALQALAQLADKGDAQAIAAVTSRLEDSVWDVRRAAVLALAQLAVLGTPHAIAAMNSRLEDLDEDVRQAAVEVLAQLK